MAEAREDAIEWVFEDVPESLILASDEHFVHAEAIRWEPVLRWEALGGNLSKEHGLGDFCPRVSTDGCSRLASAPPHGPHPRSVLTP